MNIAKLAKQLRLTEISGNPPPPEPDGAHSVTDLVLALATRVDRLDLVTLDRRISSRQDYRGDGFRLAVGPYRQRMRHVSKDFFRVERSFIEGVLREWQPDIAGAHWTYEFALGVLDSGRPHLITVRDWAPTILWSMRDPYRTVRLLMQFLTFARGRNFTAVSPYMARKVERVVRSPVVVVPNGIPESWLDANQEGSDGLCVLASNHGFDRRKNVHRLLLDWPRVRSMMPGVVLQLAGRGFEENGAAQDWAAQRGLTQGVVFQGPLARSAFRELLGEATVFAHPSLEESFGMVVLEAMASGTPVVGGAKSGAVPWLLSDGAGLLVDVRRDGALADSLLSLLRDEGHRRDLSERGRSRAKDFSIQKVADQYLGHLARIAGGG